MLNLKSVIVQMKARDYQRFAAGLEENNAINYLHLLQAYRETQKQPVSDEAIRIGMGISSTAFHTMKSRLYDKIQRHLYEYFEGTGSDLETKLEALPKLIYTEKYHPHIAIAILEYMVYLLEEKDMPHELIRVYDGLRRMHLHSPKFFDYTRIYNRQMAYALALNKAQNLSLELSRKIGEYNLSRNEETWEMVLALRQEITNISGIYNSHRLTFLHTIGELSFLLLTEGGKDVMDETSVEDLLAKAKEITEAHPSDSFYSAAVLLLPYLSFEYYQKNRIRKKAQEFFDVLNKDVPGLLRLAPLCCTSHFFISKLDFCRERGQMESLIQENTALEESGFDAELLDHVSYAHFMIHAATSYYFNGKYRGAMKYLNCLQQNVMFKNMMHAEIEVKALTILCLSMGRNFAEAKDQIKSLATKLRNHNLTRRYHHAVALLKFFRIAIKRSMVKTRYSTIKLVEYRDQFVQLNQGEDRILPFINWEDEHIMKRITMSTEQVAGRI